MYLFVRVFLIYNTNIIFKDIKCTIQQCITSTNLPECYQNIVQSQFNELYLTKKYEQISFNTCWKPENLYTYE